MSKTVTVIDYGVGNLLSVQRAFSHCGAEVTITADAETILSSERVVLPGVGAFRKAMESLDRLGLVEVIRLVVEKGVPFFGICLGMQMLLDASEEFGVTKGLGLIPGQVVRIPLQTVEGEEQKIPHIGWNELRFSEGGASWKGSLLEGTREGDAVYFVHSFMSVTSDPAHRLADCLYGGHRVPAVIRKGNVTGCQFHPEKSGEVGLRMLREFLKA